MLSAGERRSSNANDVIRDPEWRKKDRDGSLRISPDDATALGVVDGDRVRIVSKRGEAEAPAEVTDTVMSGHVTLPHGFGTEYPDESGEHKIHGVAINELTDIEDRGLALPHPPPQTRPSIPRTRSPADPGSGVGKGAEDMSRWAPDDDETINVDPAMLKEIRASAAARPAPPAEAPRDDEDGDVDAVASDQADERAVAASTEIQRFPRRRRRRDDRR